jgi:hypothetical protein
MQRKSQRRVARLHPRSGIAARQGRLRVVEEHKSDRDTTPAVERGIRLIASLL